MPGEVEVTLHSAKINEVMDNMEFGGIIAYTTDYAHHIEFDSFWGSTPPPFRPIRDWVDRKWPDLDAGLKDAGMPTNNAGENLAGRGSPRHRDGVAWVVINSIADTGIEGVFYGRRSLKHGENNAEEIALQYEHSDDPRAPEKIIEDVIDLMFETSQKIIAEEASDTGNLLQSGQVQTTETIEELPS